MKYTPILNEVEQAAQDGLTDGMKVMLERARQKAPKLDRKLIRSGAVRIDDLTGQVSFTAAHARFQHENLDYEHDDGEPKFLESAASEVIVEKYVADSIARKLSG